MVHLNWQDFKGKARLFFELCVLDIKQRTAGTSFGLFWIYLNPAISMFIIWFVFKFGIKAGAGTEDIYRLLVGLIAWQLISDSIVIGAGAFTEKPYLVKKIKFPLVFLPLIKVVNSFWIHVPFLLAALVIGVSADKLTLQGAVGMIALIPLFFSFLAVLVFFLSTITVFYRDLQSILGVAIQLIFWATPIFWSLPEHPRFISSMENFNPFYFVVSAYRFCFLGEGQFMNAFMPFLGLQVVLILATVKIFKKLKDQFSDVL